MLTKVNMFLHVPTCSYMFKHYECFTKFIPCSHRQMHIHFYDTLHILFTLLCNILGLNTLSNLFPLYLQNK